MTFDPITRQEWPTTVRAVRKKCEKRECEDPAGDNSAQTYTLAGDWRDSDCCRASTPMSVVKNRLTFSYWKLRKWYVRWGLFYSEICADESLLHEEIIRMGLVNARLVRVRCGNFEDCCPGICNDHIKRAVLLLHPRYLPVNIAQFNAANSIIKCSQQRNWTQSIV